MPPSPARAIFETATSTSPLIAICRMARHIKQCPYALTSDECNAECNAADASANKQALRIFLQMSCFQSQVRLLEKREDRAPSMCKRDGAIKTQTPGPQVRPCLPRNWIICLPCAIALLALDLRRQNPALLMDPRQHIGQKWGVPECLAQRCADSGTRSPYASAR